MGKVERPDILMSGSSASTPGRRDMGDVKKSGVHKNAQELAPSQPPFHTTVL